MNVAAAGALGAGATLRRQTGEQPLDMAKAASASQSGRSFFRHLFHLSGPCIYSSTNGRRPHLKTVTDERVDLVRPGLGRNVEDSCHQNVRLSFGKRKREARHFLRLSLNCEYCHTTKLLILSQFCLAKRLAITPRHALLRSDPAWDRWTATGHPMSEPQRRCSGRTDLDGATEIGWRAGSQAKR